MCRQHHEELHAIGRAALEPKYEIFFNVRSLQDWEQGRRRLETPIRAYLAVIQRDLQAVIRALRAA